MSTPLLNTFDLSPPRRPTLADFNNAAKADDSAYPPNVATMPNSAEYNLMARLLVAMGAVCPTARVSVLASSTPSISSVIAPGTGVNANAGAFILTRVAAGQYWVECATATTLPTFGSQPSVSLNSHSALVVAGAYATYGVGPSLGNPGVLIETELAGTLADCPFTVDFY